MIASSPTIIAKESTDSGTSTVVGNSPLASIGSAGSANQGGASPQTSHVIGNSSSGGVMGVVSGATTVGGGQGQIVAPPPRSSAPPVDPADAELVRADQTLYDSVRHSNVVALATAAATSDHPLGNHQLAHQLPTVAIQLGSMAPNDQVLGGGGSHHHAPLTAANTVKSSPVGGGGQNQQQGAVNQRANSASGE